MGIRRQGSLVVKAFAIYASPGLNLTCVQCVKPISTVTLNLGYRVRKGTPLTYACCKMVRVVMLVDLVDYVPSYPDDVDRCS